MIGGGRKNIAVQPVRINPVTINLDGRKSVFNPNPFTILECHYPHEESQLFKWIVSQRNHGLAVSSKDVRMGMLGLVQSPLKLLADVAVGGYLNREKVFLAWQQELPFGF